MGDMLERHLQRQFEHSRRFFWHRLRWRAVRSYLPADEACELVDVGAGAGLLGAYLGADRPRIRYLYVEPIPSLSAALATRHGADADRSGAADYAGARFVTLLDVLEHQADGDAFMAALVAKMDAGATVLVTVPALQRLWSGWDVALGHVRRYDKPELASCLRRSGLELREASYLFPEMYPLARWRARRAVADTAVEDPTAAEFPELPGALNDILYAVGSVSLALRRWWPFGTSVFAVAVKPAGSPPRARPYR